MSEAPTFPPLMAGEAVIADPVDAAILRAQEGCDGGLICYRVGPAESGAALVLAPDVTLEEGAAMLPLCGVGLQNALGALAPPEVAVHLDWDGTVRVNGARCGHLRAVASTDEVDVVPEWLVVGFSLAFRPGDDEPGHDPDRTALFAEGCGDLAPERLIEAWARHTMNWIDRWEREGMAPLHAEYSGLLHGLGEPLPDGATFLGLDERLGMLRKEDGATRLVPLVTLVETP
ncbi:biotin/lipoate--protein ligase family protein [Jannaschia sp. W003]|uniref:biotin/lipoate--protein ligase family protein n=1 Tax=Jannaschia sp. W003 TaxID=2867012 RepID=UPI0021A5C12D|nr:biotin/lipoate--protein ligase family protein [Jannaschia sp. W003]UWQ21480.1 hypothetical protein K3554_00095 [Jannaschia sp. W003]